MSQQELGKLCNYDYRTVAAYEKAGIRPSQDFLTAAAKALGVSTEDISGDSRVLLEESPEYRSEFQLEVLTIQQLNAIFQHTTGELEKAEGDARRKLLQTIRALADEMERRIDRDLDKHQETLSSKGKPAADATIESAIYKLKNAKAKTE